jgi:hypothetical protein
VRLLRLRLRHYRGIEDREIHFAPTGVTVVQGPNEAGKTSLAESLDLLFDELDSTTRRSVRSVQPVHRDEGAEIEADVETGPYAFTYAKRFHRHPYTRLALRRPAVENRTGREAHERVRAILEETIDTDLWKALRVQQGEALTPVALARGTALAAALDRAAGSAGGGAREESLFAAAREEYGRYFTPTGRAKRDLLGEREARDAARAEADALGEALAGLEEDVQREAALRAALAGLEPRIAAAEAGLREAEREQERVSSLREAYERATLQRDAALAEERHAREAARQRAQLVTAERVAETEVAERSADLESARPGLLATRAELDHAEQMVATAADALAAASEAVRCRRRDRDHRRGEAELAALEGRLRRLDATLDEARAAERLLAESRIDEATVEQIGEARAAVERARARVEAEGPLVQVAPHVDLEVMLDGRRAKLVAGRAIEQRVAESLVLSLEGVADVTVVAGAGAAARLKVLEEAVTRHRTLCAEAGVGGHAAALQALTARRTAERTLAARDRTLRDLLGGQDAQALTARRDRLRARVTAYPAERPAGLALPADAEAAEALLESAEAQLLAAQAAHADAVARRDARARRLLHLEQHERDTTLRLDLASESLADHEARLREARARDSDAAVETRREACERATHRAEAALREAEVALAAARPEEVETAARDRRRERETLERARTAARDERIDVSARLAALGPTGLYEQLARAELRASRAERAVEALDRRAAAAELLYTTLRRERDTLRRGVAGPLARQIAELGRHVFGESFAVELDEDLRVASRSLGGIRLDFEQLSAGAREQLTLIARLAAARLVAADGGAPVILDDALGHSDPERLARMGRALSAVGAHCQIVVLTCVADRFRHVEGARRVELT